MVKTTTAVGFCSSGVPHCWQTRNLGGRCVPNPDITTLPSKADLRGDTGCTSLGSEALSGWRRRGER